MATEFKQFMKQLWQHFLDANITDSAAVLSYYMLLSFFPIFLIVGNIITLLRINVNNVLRYIEPLLPDAVYQTFQPVIRSFFGAGEYRDLITGCLSHNLVGKSSRCGIPA